MYNEIVRYLERTGMKETSFGRKVVQDSRLLSDMRRGRTLRPRTVERIRQFIADHPEGFLNANS